MANLDILKNTESSSLNAAGKFSQRPASKTMDAQAKEQKEMFLQLLMTQLKHQSPDNPMNPNEMLNSFYQMANYEKLSEMNSSIDKLTGVLQHNSNTQTGANIVGKSIILETTKAKVGSENKVKIGYMLDGKQGGDPIKISLYGKDGKLIAERTIKDTEANKMHSLDITLSEEEAAKMFEDKEKILSIVVKKKENNVNLPGAKIYAVDTIEQILANGDILTTSNGLKKMEDIMGFDNSHIGEICKEQHSHELERIQKIYGSLNDIMHKKTGTAA